MNTVKNIIKVLEAKGFTILEVTRTKIFGVTTVSAARKTDSGNLEIMWGDNGTAKVFKPNGTTRWYYEKSVAQIARALDQSIESNTYSYRR